MLTETKKKDREEMTRKIQALCERLGVAFEVCPILTRDREIMLHIQHPSGLRLSHDFNGDSTQPDTYVITWNIEQQVKARFSDDLGHLCGHDSINPYHRCKATCIAHGFDDLIMHLEEVFNLTNAGSVFLPESEAITLTK